MRCHLLMDADDTLWENNIYYEQAIYEFISWIDHPHYSHEEIRTMLDEIERGMGYGSASFTRSLIELHRRLAGKDPSEEELTHIRRLGESTGNYPIQLMEGVKETLDYLSRRHDLLLVTKGDDREQQRKVDESGIKACFRQAVVVKEKDVATYRRIVNELQIDVTRAWMVGNSPRSDINPALAAGLRAVFIPHPQTWRLEHAQIDDPGDGRLLNLSTFAELRTHF